MNVIAGTKIRVTVIDDSRWYCVRDVTDFLGYGHEASAYSRFYAPHKAEIETQKIKIDTVGGSQPALFVRDTSLVYLTARCKKTKCAELLVALGIWNSESTRVLLKYFPDTVQTPWVKEYRVGIYMPDLGIVVDGATHSSDRTKKINEHLGNPEWICYDPVNFNVEETVKRVIAAMHRRITDRSEHA